MISADQKVLVNIGTAWVESCDNLLESPGENKRIKMSGIFYEYRKKEVACEGILQLTV